MLDASGRRCVMCGDAGSDGNGRGLHLAHIVPAPLGSNDPSDLQAMCGSCHRKWDAARAAAVQQCLAANAAASSGGGGLDTPGSTKGPGRAHRPSHGSAQMSGNLELSGGVGAGSFIVPSPFGGVWGCSVDDEDDSWGRDAHEMRAPHEVGAGSTMFTSDSRGIFGGPEVNETLETGATEASETRER